MYKDYNDFELIYLINDGNEDASNLLYEKYKPIINIKIKRYLNYGKKVGLEYNDLFQEGMIGLSKAISGFKLQKDVQFSTFANLCIERQIFSILTKASRKKHNILNDSLSLDNTYNDDDTVLLDFLFDKNLDPSIYLEGNETKNRLYNNILSILTPFEKKVFDYKIKNFDYKEIATLLNKSYKSIDCAIQRIKNKIKKLLESDK